MARTLNGTVTTAVGAAVTLPGYLVAIDFATPVYLSSRGDLTWNSKSWVAWAVRIIGLAIDGAASAQDGTLILGNTDYTMGALVLAEGVAGRAVSVWKLYGETPALADPVLVFSGVADGATINPDGGDVTITLQQAGGVTLYCPRTYINRASGFSHIPADGTLIQWNGETFRLTAEK